MKNFLFLSMVVFSPQLFATDYDVYQRAVSTIMNASEVQERITQTLNKIHKPFDYDAPMFRGVQFADGLSELTPNRVLFDVVVGGLEQGRYCLRCSLTSISLNDLKIEDEFKICEF